MGMFGKKHDITKGERISLFKGKQFLGDLWLNSWSIQLVLPNSEKKMKVQKQTTKYNGIQLIVEVGE